MSHSETANVEKKNMSLLIRGAIWIAIGALIAAALVCVVWVLIGDGDGLIGRAFLTILLLAGFAGIAILEASLAPNRPDWLALSSMVSWIVALLVGAVKIWLPEPNGYFVGAERFFQLLLVVGVLQLALLHVRLFIPATRRHLTTFTRIIAYTTVAFLAGLVGMLVFYLTFPETFVYGELYWRIVVALTILTAVGTTLVPLLNALFAPRKRAAAAAPTAPVLAWPTYADGVTPLPALPDATPDWNAYYTGYPSYPQTPGLPPSPQPQVQSLPPATLPPVAVPTAPPATTQSPAVSPAPPAPPSGAPVVAPPPPAVPPAAAPPAPPAGSPTAQPPAPPVPPAPTAPPASPASPEPPR